MYYPGTDVELCVLRNCSGDVLLLLPLFKKVMQVGHEPTFISFLTWRGSSEGPLGGQTGTSSQFRMKAANKFTKRSISRMTHENS